MLSEAGQEIRELEYHLVCIGCVVKDTIMELEPARSMDSDEWTSHHNMRGQIIYSDARLAITHSTIQK